MPRAAAILAVGHGLGDGTEALTSLVAQIGETLLANSGEWRVRRLSPLAGERDGADRASLKRHVAELCEADVDVIVLALAGIVEMHADEPCLVTGPDAKRFPEDATLPLTWIRDRLRTCRADRVVVVASLDGPADDNDWLDLLGTGRARHVVTTERSNGRALALVALLDGLRGAAIDPKTGTVTLRSLGEHLARVVPRARLQLSEESETLASSPPLAGPWDARLTSRSGPRVIVDEDLVGTVLPGRFAIQRELARGSFGTVYVARQLSVDRDVAVKVLHGSIAPGSETGRLFVQEIQSVGRLTHPNIVRIYQADITGGGALFYAMELLDGRDLQQIIESEGVMHRDRAVALVCQLAAALGAAHEVELVHADVKPANAMVVPGKPDERLVLLDFGLARLRGAAGGSADPAGGTPAYMAPEQLRDGRVDARSDVFSAALVLVTLLTGWRRRTADQLVPPLDGIDDPVLRRVLARALALAPGDRYQSGGELAEALGAREHSASIVTSPPFRHLAAFTEADRDRLYGRDREIATLVEHVLFRRAVVYTAPSGTGKTSLLRAGLVPRLGTLGVSCVYVACHGREPPDLARAIWAEGDTPAAAARLRIASEKKRLVIVIDQVEAALANSEFARALRELECAASDLELGFVLSVREDVLASLLAQLDARSNVVRLGPLTPEGAREAIIGPLIERRITIEDSLLEALLIDLERAASLLASEMRWAAERAIYPPHLQLACSALYDQRGSGEQVLALRHYEQLGGLDEIVRDYLDRVLETELPAELVASARRVLLALIESDRTRAVRTDGELAERVGQDVRLAPVLEVLRQHGIVVPLRADKGQPAWELVHDSLVPRILAWSDRQDLARQRALEIVRHHLRGSRGDQPSLLTADELREVRHHADAIDELELEWQKRETAAWTPKQLVEKSRRARRNRRLAVVVSIATALSTAGFFGWRWFSERQQRQQEELLSRGNVGSFILELRAFDWDEKNLRPVYMPAGASGWDLFEPSSGDELAPSDTPLTAAHHEIRSGDPMVRTWRVSARGGKAILVVSRPGCAPSIIPLARLPGYLDKESRLQVVVPTCGATRRDTIDVEAGPYISRGLGDPPIAAIDGLALDEIPPEKIVHLARYAIDRTEVSNAAYRMFTAETQSSAVAMPKYPNSSALTRASQPNYPATHVTWWQARAYCRFLGKQLPSDEQWEKAMRGGLRIHGVPNPRPRRTLPWGTSDPRFANLSDTGGQQPAPVGDHPSDISPYGVLDLAGNVSEWIRTKAQDEFYATRGCSWGPCTTGMLASVLATPNIRPASYVAFDLGFRCVSVE